VKNTFGLSKYSCEREQKIQTSKYYYLQKSEGNNIKIKYSFQIPLTLSASVTISEKS